MQRAELWMLMKSSCSRLGARPLGTSPSITNSPFSNDLISPGRSKQNHTNEKGWHVHRGSYFHSFAEPLKGSLGEVKKDD